MPDIIIEVEGLAALQARFNKLADVGAVVGPALVASGNELRAWASLYPPASEANMPKAHGRWYERGYGSRYARRDGMITGRKTSQLLNRRWSTQSSITPAAVEVRIGNSATYARYVHDETRQAHFHGPRGWRTAQAAIRKFEPAIIRRIIDALDKATR